MLAAASDTANPDQYQYQADHFQAAHYAAATAAAAAAAAAGAPAPTQHYARYQGTLAAGQQTPAAAAQQYTAATGQQYPGAAITVGQACELPSLHLKVALRTWAKLRFPSTYRYVSPSFLCVTNEGGLQPAGHTQRIRRTRLPGARGRASPARYAQHPHLKRCPVAGPEQHGS